jgi:signal transduction histidine kinase
VPPVKGDAKKVDEILINLIDNAIKYSPDGGEVRVSMVRDGDFVEVSVEDSGIGIAPEDAARLFQKFHRVSTPETRDIGGTGLGLYIVKNLVEAHGGRIWLQSAPGVGTTFTFTLPVSPANR